MSVVNTTIIPEGLLKRNSVFVRAAHAPYITPRSLTEWHSLRAARWWHESSGHPPPEGLAIRDEKVGPPALRRSGHPSDNRQHEIGPSILRIIEIMPEAQTLRPPDHMLTVIAIGIVAYIAAIQSHEVLGHGIVALLCGARTLTLSTIALSTDIDNRVIPAAGPAVNFIAAALASLFGLRITSGAVRSPSVAYFVLLFFAFNLLLATGYFLFGGLTGAGDLAAVVHGWNPAWAWRVALGVIGLAGYYVSIRLVSISLVRFRTLYGGDAHRISRLMLIPYLAAAALAALGALRSPVGISILWMYALPSTLLGNIGLLIGSHIAADSPPATALTALPIAPVPRSLPWLIISAILAGVFILLIGPGVTILR